MSEQKRAISKLEFTEKGVDMGFYAGPVPNKKEEPYSLDEVLAECNQSLLDDWDRRFHEANRINSEWEDLDKDSHERISEIYCPGFQDSTICGGQE